jgi:outer membrane protein assembly factor BamB
MTSLTSVSLLRLFQAMLFAMSVTPQAYAQSRGNRAESYPPLASFVTFDKPILTIGSEDSDGPTLFGDITGVTVDSQRNIYVLDYTSKSVRVFAKDGRFIGSAGRPGRGPADMSWPLAIFHDGSSRFFVFDYVNGVIVYSSKDGQLTHQRTFGAEYRPSNACLLGDKLVIPGWRDKKILHVFDINGQHVRSFGESFWPDSSDAVKDFAARQVLRIHCDAALNRVYVAASSIGLARAYRPDGELLWEQQLPEFDGSRVIVTQRGMTVVWGTYTTASILRLGGDLVLVQAKVIKRVRSSQVGPHGRRGSEEDAGVITYVLSATTGQLLTRAPGAPLIGTATSNLAVTYQQDPFPRVALVPWLEARR